MEPTGSTCVHALTWLKVIGLMAIPGFLGGVLDVLQLIDLKRLVCAEDYAPVGSWKRFWSAVALGGCGGCGGAVAVLFLGVWTNQLDTTKSDTRNMVLLATLGLVSGFLGYKALKKVADNVDKRFSDIQDDIKRAEARAVEESALLDQCLSALRTNAPESEIATLAKKLESVHQRRQADRRVGIVLGNLHDRLKNYNEAIAVVTRVLAGKSKLNTSSDTDAGDLLFNRACYRIPLLVQARQNHSDADEARIKEDIMADLKRAVSLNPTNKDIARGDADLQILRGDQAFQDLIRA
jgi:hypothetical protein